MRQSEQEQLSKASKSEHQAVDELEDEVRFEVYKRDSQMIMINA